jgi:hypothetical protein
MCGANARLKHLAPRNDARPTVVERRGEGGDLLTRERVERVHVIGAEALEREVKERDARVVWHEERL